MSSGREEGEIDSEEDGLRKRINELEEENAEYEKIKRISECYAYKYDDMYRLNDYSDWEAVQRAGQVPTDVSSISSDEFPSPKKKKHKRNKKGKCKRLQQRAHRCAHQRQKHCKSQSHGEKRHHHRRERLLNPYYQNRGIETISLDTTDNSEYEKDNYSIATMDIESADENDGNLTLPLSREELRLALGRGVAERKNNICSLKERLQPDKYAEVIIEEKVQTLEESTPYSNDADNVVELNSDDSMSIEEQELRLIALRSAIMKKHATRKKRNAEIAYSPTDFDDLLAEPVSPVASDIEELEGDMEISPASSPNLILSPIHCDDEQNSNISLETIEHQVDNKPVDMDIACSDSEREESTSNVVDADGIYSQHTHDIPLPPGSAPLEGMGIPIPYDYHNHAKSMPFDMYMPPMHFGTQIDMPPTMIPMPTMPQFPMSEVVQTAVAGDALENCIKNEVLNGQRRMSASPKSASMDIIPEDTQDQPEECSDEEEAEALRALLLSQRQAAKTAKSNGQLRVRKPSPTADTPPQIATAHAKEMESIIKPHPQQPSTLPGEHNETSVKSKPTESILKEAVRRLKVKSVVHCEDEQTHSETQPQAHAPRLKIRAFARCKEYEEEQVVDAQPADCAGYHKSAFAMHAGQVNGINFDHMLQEESRSSFGSTLRRNTPEILDMHTNSSESAAILLATKRRLEKEAPMGRTLRTIELKQSVENYSQHSAEDINSEALEKNKTHPSYESQAKKAKTTTEQTGPTDATSLHLKERAPPNNVTRENDANASGEKENKEVSSATASVNESATNAAVKAKLLTKAAAKITKIPDRRKAGALTATATQAAAAGKAPTAAPAKQPASKTVPTRISTPPAATAKVLKPAAQQLKIVKPNKVINKSLETSEESVGTLKKKVDAATNQSRILTSTTLPNIKVKKLIIRVGHSDSSSEDEEILRNHTLERCIGLACVRTATPDSLTGVLNENVYGGKEAITKQNLSTEQAAETRSLANDGMSNASAAKENNVGESFEKKLENFLKNMRSQATQKSGTPSAEQPRLRKLSAASAQTTKGTPTAVRSLPIASQEEYKRLVNRMKILEKQKHLKKMQKSLLEDVEKCTKSKQNTAKRMQKPNQAQGLAGLTASTATQTSTDASTVANEMLTSTVESGTQQQQQQQEPDCEHQHSKKSPTANSLETAGTPGKTTQAAPKNERVLTERLYSCEKILTSVSNNILTRLDKSLHLVNEAKAAKIAKMRHEQRLKELRLEMEQTQRKMKEEQVKISRIHPEICANNEMITKLKQKRARVLDMAVKLGKSVKGDDYRLNNDSKNEITRKTKGLATHIKLVNSIRYCDLDVLEKEATALPVNSSDKDTNEAPTSNSQQSHAANNEHKAPSTNVAKESENIEEAVIASPRREACEPESDNCTHTQNTTPIMCDQIVDGQVNAQDLNKNCDKANEKVPPTACVEACVEELPAPMCDSGKEVVRIEDNKPEQVDNVKAAGDQVVSTARSVRDYVSPLEHLRNESGKWNPNDIICPYELMGQCEDKDCSYRHLTDK
ncbi:uncharacterized protein LOC118744754 [Rhagoletis pomonella]|uniref:uncharacterized protein LOC118744754 n=1 Tax=Rhagoletis pomonella TaxID=28610 RepID=UPI00178186B3|nr:uncharacterized protein LOC118744754 [Rhagoletis pomonella]